MLGVILREYSMNNNKFKVGDIIINLPKGDVFRINSFYKHTQSQANVTCIELYSGKDYHHLQESYTANHIEDPLLWRLADEYLISKEVREVLSGN